MKKSWKKTEGFTLVELIVVIAILGILAGVGTVGYSGYIKKANMAADEAMVSGIKNALTLAAITNRTSGDVVVKLSPTADAEVIASVSGEANVAKNALLAAFGEENWDTLKTALKLKSSDWQSKSDGNFATAYKASSYNGKEDALVGEIGKLTNMLASAIAADPSLVGTSFNEYLEGLNNQGVDTSDTKSIANAAVLYAANTVSNDEDETKAAAVTNAFNKFYDSSSPSTYANVGELAMSLKNTLGTFGAVAAIYAHGEAFAQYTGDQDFINSFHNQTIDTTSTNDALDSVANALGFVVQQAATTPKYQDKAFAYMNGATEGNAQFQKDVNGYLSALTQINKNESVFTGSLGSSTCYTDGTASNLLMTMVATGSLEVPLGGGEVAVAILPNGIAVADPMDYMN